MNRALLVGINAYPGSPLSGCINDVEDMAGFLVAKCNFKAEDIRLVTDARATTAGILERLAWLVSGARKGDRLFFHYSGHGAQVPTRTPAGELDGKDEVICPVDFDWSDQYMIRDKDFNRLFAGVPSGVEFVWVSDSCHSGDLQKDMPPPNIRLRRFPVPADFRWRQLTAKAIKAPGPGMAKTAQALNVALISGCRSDQTSADASFGGRPNGALTYYLLQVLGKAGGLKDPLDKLVPKMVKAIGKAGYSQVPQLEGSAAIMKKHFLA